MSLTRAGAAHVLIRTCLRVPDPGTSRDRLGGHPTTALRSVPPGPVRKSVDLRPRI